MPFYPYNGDGDVSGPASSTDNAVTRFSGTGGKTLKNSGVTVDDSNNVTANSYLIAGGPQIAQTSVNLGGVAKLLGNRLNNIIVPAGDYTVSNAVSGSWLLIGATGDGDTENINFPISLVDGASFIIQSANVLSSTNLVGTGGVVISGSSIIKPNDLYLCEVLVYNGITDVSAYPLYAENSPDSLTPTANTLIGWSGAAGIVNQTPSQALDIIGSTQGNILYRGAAGWAVLAPSTAGYVLQTGGPAANPSWTANGAGDVVGPGSSTATAIALWNGTNGIDVKNSVVTVDASGNTAGMGTLSCGAITSGGDLGVTGDATVSGVVTTPGQPAFSAYLATTATNTTGNNTTYTLGTHALTEIFDQGSDFNTNGTFTAPVTGKYLLNACIRFSATTVATGFAVNFVTTQGTYYKDFQRDAGGQNESLGICELVPMAAGDTAYVTVVVVGEAGDTVSLTGSASPFMTRFSGFLAC